MTEHQEQFLLARVEQLERRLVALERANKALGNSLKFTNELLMQAIAFASQMDVEALGAILPTVKKHIDVLATIK